MTPKKSPRLYVPLDARFFDHDQTVRVGERAAFLYLNILCSIKLDQADGTISRSKISRLGIQGWQVRVEKLLEEGLLLDITSPEHAQITYLVPSWSKWNLLKHEIEHRREAGREAALRRWKRDAKPNGTPNGSPTRYPMQREEKKRKEVEPLGSLIHNLVDEMSFKAEEDFNE